VAEKSWRPRDEHGRFLPKEEVEEAADASSQPADAPDSSTPGTETIDISDTVAPSVGPHTTFTRTAHVEGHEASDIDAMGLDKRRSVVGESYAPSFGRQATMYGIFLAVLAAIVIGGKMLADELDQPSAEAQDEAVWTGNEIQPTDIDSRPSGDVQVETSAP
jgi:hypothetical protein